MLERDHEGLRVVDRQLRGDGNHRAGGVARDVEDAAVHRRVRIAGRIEFFVRKALERWEPRIVLKQVRAEPAGERMEIDVRYIVRRTNREDNVVVPFFAGALP